MWRRETSPCRWSLRGTSEVTASFIAVLAMDWGDTQMPDQEPTARLLSFAPRDLLHWATPDFISCTACLSNLRERHIMLHLAKDLWTDQSGFVVSAELVLISTVGSSASARDSSVCAMP